MSHGSLANIIFFFKMWVMNSNHQFCQMQHFFHSQTNYLSHNPQTHIHMFLHHYLPKFETLSVLPWIWVIPMGSICMNKKRWIPFRKSICKNKINCFIVMFFSVYMRVSNWVPGLNQHAHAKCPIRMSKPHRKNMIGMVYIPGVHAC